VTTSMDRTHASSGPAADADSTTSARMILTMGGIGFFCGILIVLTFQLTLPVITKNKAEALERAIFEVVPDATGKKAFALVDGTLRPLAADDDAQIKYYACYNGGRELVGVAVEASGQGFQDVLRVLYGYSPARSCIVGLKVLESKETPGLGDKIETDPTFRSNFDSLTVELDASRFDIVHAIELVKPGKKTESWQVEAITGATISSRAIATILRKSTEVTVPVIAKNLAVLEEEGIE